MRNLIAVLLFLASFRASSGEPDVRKLFPDFKDASAAVSVAKIRKIEVVEQPAFWVEIANDQSLPLKRRRIAVQMFFERHVKKNARLNSILAIPGVKDWFSLDKFSQPQGGTGIIFSLSFTLSDGEVYILEPFGKDGGMTIWIGLNKPIASPLEKLDDSVLIKEFNIVQPGK